MVNSATLTECITNSSEAFNSNINNWAEGVVLTIDADHSKLTIRGTKRPYASEYAKMLKKIHDATEKMTQDDRARQASQIRLEWKGALETAHAKEAEKDRDFTFQLPGKNGTLVIVDETPFYNCETQLMAPESKHANLTDKECKAIRELNGLKVGECVVVGYESGLLKNDAYVVIKANKCSSK
jgi:hypothetical protein